MKAHQMFKELGYKMTMNDGVPIYFRDHISVTVFERSVLVKMAGKKADEGDFSYFTLGKSEVEAIAMQMKELGEDNE